MTGAAAHAALRTAGGNMRGRDVCAVTARSSPVYDTIEALFAQAVQEDRRLTDEERAMVSALRVRTFRLWKQEFANLDAGDLSAFTFRSNMGGRDGTQSDPLAEDIFQPNSLVRRAAHPRSIRAWPGLSGVYYEETPGGDAPSPAEVAAAAYADEAGRTGTALAEHWVTCHGVAFAAETVVEYAALRGRDADECAARVRELLAEAHRASMNETVARLSQHRERSLDSRVLTSFLFPLERSWVAADTAEVISADAVELVERLVQSVTEVKHLT